MKIVGLVRKQVLFHQRDRELKKVLERTPPGTVRDDLLVAMQNSGYFTNNRKHKF